MLLGAARAFLFEVAREIDQAWQSGRQLPRELAIKRRLANVHAVEAVMTIVDSLYITAGTSTFYGESRLPQCVRDIRTVSQHFVASPSNVEMAGRYQLTGRFEPRL
jgi:alkylation response protein AidB-like acyl-CoA dehydrogenase